MKTLYTVEAGEYSDHSILVVFEDEALAAQHAIALQQETDGWRRDAFVGKIVLMHALPVQKTIYYRCGSMRLSDKVVLRDDTHERKEWEYGSCISPPFAKVTGARTYTAPAYPGCVQVGIQGGDKDAVNKAFNDRMRKVKSGIYDAQVAAGIDVEC